MTIGAPHQPLEGIHHNAEKFSNVLQLFEEEA